MHNRKAWAAIFLAVLLVLLAGPRALADTKPEASDTPAEATTADDALQTGDAPDSESDTIIDLPLGDSEAAAGDAVEDEADGDEDPPSDENFLEVQRKKEQVRQLAKQFVGTPYRWGGTTPNAFDCSGLTCYVYKQLGVELPRTASQQYKAGDPVRKGAEKTGDLVFFDINKGRVSHVGLYLGKRTFIHASTPRTGVKIDSLTKKYYKKRYVGARRYGVI